MRIVEKPFAFIVAGAILSCGGGGGQIPAPKASSARAEAQRVAPLEALPSEACAESNAGPVEVEPSGHVLEPDELQRAIDAIFAKEGVELWENLPRLGVVEIEELTASAAVPLDGASDSVASPDEVAVHEFLLSNQATDEKARQEIKRQVLRNPPTLEADGAITEGAAAEEVAQ